MPKYIIGRSSVCLRRPAQRRQLRGEKQRGGANAKGSQIIRGCERFKALSPSGSPSMNLSIRTRSGFRSGPDALPYTKEALERDLERVRGAWDDCQTDRRRDAIYGYLKAVYDLVNWWSAEKCEADRARQALCLRGSRLVEYAGWAYRPRVRRQVLPVRAFFHRD